MSDDPKTQGDGWCHECQLRRGAVVPKGQLGVKSYALKIVNIGEDDYGFMSKGHHNAGEFMRAVRDFATDYPLSRPKHVFYKVVPDPSGDYAGFFHEVDKETRGAFPATVTFETHGNDQYNWKESDVENYTESTRVKRQGYCDNCKALKALEGEKK